MSCWRRYPPLRPISPRSTGDFFPHPLFFIYGPIRTTPCFVVPEYFFQNVTTFDGLGDPSAEPHYVFPFFVQKLFEYVHNSATGSNVGSFITYYSARETAWCIPAGAGVGRSIQRPHQILKRHWRWEEVLTMLYEFRQSRGEKRLCGCTRAPHGYSQDEQIAAYFERFARMAAIWSGEALERASRPVRRPYNLPS